MPAHSFSKNKEKVAHRGREGDLLKPDGNPGIEATGGDVKLELDGVYERPSKFWM